MRVVTAGDNCVDFYVETDESFPGGNPVNVAVYCKRYFNDVGYIGFVGEDWNGNLIVHALKAKGVDTSLVQVVPKGRTAVTKVKLQKQDRVFCGYDPGVHSQFTLSEDALAFIASSDMFITGYWGNAHPYLEELKRRNGKLLIGFDFATKLDDPIYAEIAPFIDCAFFSWDGPQEQDSIEFFMREQQSSGARLVVVTLGKKGSIAFDGRKFFTYGIIPCKVIDTMGAGDSYIAGFMSAQLMGHSIEESMRMGTESSTITIQYKGAW